MNSPYKQYIKEFIIKKIGNRNILNQKNDFVIQDKDTIRVASILDEISYECFKYEAEFVQLRINNWKQMMINTSPHLLFVEAAWEGYNKEWINKVANLHLSNDNPLLSIIKYCNENNIPTVFWAKEDPADFNIFIKTAKHFDYIFTTDSSSIDKYKKVLNHNNIFVLPFAAQPKIHNPINKDKIKIGKVAFAGGWYNKFPNRCMDMENLLKPAFKYNLTIYDRFKNSNNKCFSFPPEYKPYIKDSLSYNDIIKEYKKYEVFLNVNSIDNSPTTFSRRVFELLACGIPVISSYSLGIRNYFKDIVILSNNAKDTNEYLNTLINNKEIIDKLSIMGQREVLNNHTYKDRFKTILDSIGLDKKNNLEEGVSVITCTNRLSSLENIINNYLPQKYPVKELILIIINNSISKVDWTNKLKDYKNIKLYQLPESYSLGKCLNFGVKHSKYDYISKFSDDDYYAPDYLTDAINTFKFTDAHIVGKCSIYSYFEWSDTLVLHHPNKENAYIDFVSGSTLTMKKDIFNKVAFKDISQDEDTFFQNDSLNQGFKIYASDRFNHVCIRRKDLNTHTWKMSEQEFMKKCIFITKTKDFKSIVIV